MPSVSTTMNIGVISRLPFSLTNSFAPFHSSVAGRCVLGEPDEPRFSSYSSSSSSSPSLASLTAV